MNILYKYRGFITAFLAVILFVSPPALSYELAAVPIFVLSALLRIWARMYIGLHSRGSTLAAPQIITTGPYFLFKHPLYLSNWLAGAAFAVLHSGFSAFCAVFCLIYLIYLLSLSIRETVFLREMAHITETYTYKPQAKDLSAAIFSDKWTWFWQFIVIIIIFARKTLT